MDSKWVRRYLEGLPQEVVLRKTVLISAILDKFHPFTPKAAGDILEADLAVRESWGVDFHGLPWWSIPELEYVCSELGIGLPS